MEDAHIRPVRRLGKARHQIRVIPGRRLEEEAADRRQHAGQGIEGLQPARQMAQGPEHAAEVRRGPKVLKARQRRIAGRRQAGSVLGQGLRPRIQAPANPAKGVVRRPDAFHHRPELRRVQVAGDQGQRIQRSQERRQEIHDVP
jgi:hypothetical protein